MSLLPATAPGSVELRQFLQDSQRLVVISGAGVSTASGIGDYRDRNGEWKRPQPVQHEAFMSSHSWRQRYWARSQIGYREFIRARPNATHQVLARWEKRGHLLGLITQNVDRLHQRAGHQQVIDLHGRLDQVVCMKCDARVSRNDVQVWLEARNAHLETVAFALAPDGDADLQRQDFSDVQVPQCQACGGILKPDVVFYGDSVSKPVVSVCYAWIDEADALLIVGSSLMVYSSFRFVRRAAANNLSIVAINQGKTRADSLLKFKLEADCGVLLTQLEASMASEGNSWPEV